MLARASCRRPKYQGLRPHGLALPHALRVGRSDFFLTLGLDGSLDGRIVNRLWALVAVVRPVILVAIILPTLFVPVIFEGAVPPVFALFAVSPVTSPFPSATFSSATLAAATSTSTLTVISPTLLSFLLATVAPVRRTPPTTALGGPVAVALDLARTVAAGEVHGVVVAQVDGAGGRANCATTLSRPRLALRRPVATLGRLRPAALGSWERATAAALRRRERRRRATLLAIALMRAALPQHKTSLSLRTASHALGSWRPATAAALRRKERRRREPLLAIALLREALPQHRTSFSLKTASHAFAATVATTLLLAGGGWRPPISREACAAVSVLLAKVFGQQEVRNVLTVHLKELNELRS